jgi:hypothetical protein
MYPSNLSLNLSNFITKNTPHVFHGFTSSGQTPQPERSKQSAIQTKENAPCLLGSICTSMASRKLVYTSPELITELT